VIAGFGSLIFFGWEFLVWGCLAVFSGFLWSGFASE